MNNYKLLVLFSFFTIFLLSGCLQAPPEPESIDKNESSPSDTIDKEKIDSSTPSKEESDLPDLTERGSNDLPELKVHYINVGQADSTLLQFPYEGDDFTILIDAGNWNRNDVVNYLASHKISEIDLAIGTHPDADHIGQLDKVLNTFDVGEVWLSGNTSNSQTFQRLLQAIDAKGVDYYEPRMGEEFEIGPLKMDVLYPRTISEQDNDESISLKITYGDVRFIFTGDASTDDELKMLQSGFNVEADILQLGHHGSSTSTHPRFLSAVHPDVAIYSAGVDNSYGHPHDEVVERVRGSDAQLYGTNVHGTIIVTTDGKDYNLLTKKDGTITPSSNSPNNDDSTNHNSNSEPNTSKTSCININEATFEQLQEITHIGPARAQELINLRPFESIDDLSRINGIGPSRIEDIKSQGLPCLGG
ncbi:Metal-dependent hydrolase, beta-lactamase superfamily II [Mesobacillus persicus]|uniref:Metal-dependent hydrolase, beta-lactamase superfamily II n=1 Tax=Mesobacillus persicus TaxID=930146 RepID=A0A1H8HEX8_9BACI|nr:MBL fold metallo-hydrolase [Mesobacillus persicus]SEN54821.1 Metal-dependent hydrolase, beta-lactamase superfamily II [Mesobacillus persicus]